MHKFKIIRGVHSFGGKTYTSGIEGQNIIETEENLLLRNNPSGIRPRFVLLNNFAPISENQEDVDDNLENQTVAQLRQFAEEGGIELGTATRKDEILSTIRGEMQLQ